MARLTSKSCRSNTPGKGTAKIAGNKAVLLPLAGAVALPATIGFFETGAIDLVWRLFFWAAFFLVPIVIFGMVYTWSRSDEGLLSVRLHGAGEAGKVKAERLSETVGGTAEVSELYANILANDPENLTALKHFLKRHRYDDEEEGAWFVKLLEATVKRDFQSAVRLVRDHYPRHLNRLTGDLLFRIGVELYQYADYEKARLCLDLAAVKEGPWQAKAMLILSRTYEAVGNPDRAAAVLEELLEQEPEDTFRRQAALRLMGLKGRGKRLQELTNVA